MSAAHIIGKERRVSVAHKNGERTHALIESDFYFLGPSSSFNYNDTIGRLRGIKTIISVSLVCFKIKTNHFKIKTKALKADSDSIAEQNLTKFNFL